MKWVKCGLWIVAWAAWAWCGERLYVELPRELTPPSCKLAIEDSPPRVLGFIGEDLVVSQSDALAQTTAFAVWDAVTGRLRHRLRGPLTAYLQEISLRHGIVLGTPCRDDAERAETEDHWHVLDLRTGAWKAIPRKADRWSARCRVHPSKPWAAFGDQDRVDRPEVIDLLTGKLVCSTLSRADASATVGRPLDWCWLGSGELLVVRDLGNIMQLERWDVAAGRRVASVETSRPEDQAVIPAVDGGIRIVGTGMMALHSDERFVVLDNRTGETLLDGEIPFAPRRPRGPRKLPVALGTNLPYAADDTGTVLSPDGSMRRLADGRLLWQAARFESVYGAVSRGSFLVLERWSEVFDGGPSLLDRVTWAVRDLATGDLRYRVRDTHPSLDCLSDTCASGIDYDGNVYAMPPPPNYPLLALCQTILALPLVLLWAALRWRRKRKMRLAGAAP